MGNTLSVDGCCAPDRSSLKRSNSSNKKTQQCYGPPMFEGDVISLAYTEWEEIIALSRAITPGGKLLGLSSTKKMLATLHRSNSPMIIPTVSSTTAINFYSIKLWEVNRAVGGVEKLRSQLTTSNGNDSGKGSSSTDKDNSAAPKATPIACLELSPGTKVSKVVLLDSANPQYVVGTVSRILSSSSSSSSVNGSGSENGSNSSSSSNSSSKGRHAATTTTEVCVWRLQPTPKRRISAAEMDVQIANQNIIKKSQNSNRHTKKLTYKMELKKIATLNGHQTSVPVSITANNNSNSLFAAAAANQNGIHHKRAISNKEFKPSGGEGDDEESKNNSSSVNVDAGVDAGVNAGVDAGVDTGADANGSSENGSSTNGSGNANNNTSRLIGDCSAMATLRDYLFVGDEVGQLFAWSWSNWYDVDWRRVNRRRRRASLASKQLPHTYVPCNYVSVVFIYLLKHPLTSFCVSSFYLLPSFFFPLLSFYFFFSFSAFFLLLPSSPSFLLPSSPFFLLLLSFILFFFYTPFFLDRPIFVPIPISGGSISPNFGLPHPGGVTCVKVSHARSGMEVYTCGRDHTVKLWRVVNSPPSSPSSSASSSSSTSTQYLEHYHTIDAPTHGLYNLRCLEVSQTPDVGAAWYAGKSSTCRSC